MTSMPETGDALDREGAEPILPPRRMAELPAYDGGWATGGGTPMPYLSYVEDNSEVNWSEDLAELHEEDSRVHFIDRWTRDAIVSRIGTQPAGAVIADIGCSTGYLLEDLAVAHPQARLIGVDWIASGLRVAHASLPSARLLRADACALPIADASLDGVVSANLLEHISDDGAALREIFRVLRPGAPAVLVVPAGPSTFDYYDRFLDHERRYGRRELASKCSDAGLEVIEDMYIAGLLYPAFWLVKKRNRLLRRHLSGAALEARVAADIAATRNSGAGVLAWRLERALLRAGVKMPFGIRSLVLARCPVRPEGRLR